MFCEKGVLRNFAKFTGNTCARVSFLIKLQAACRLPACEISKNTFFYRTPVVAVSEHSRLNVVVLLPTRLRVSLHSVVA